MNPVARQIPIGLSSWKALGGNITFLKTSNKKVPRVWLRGKSDKMIVLASGLHLEETSGPMLLLEPETLLHSLKPALDKGIGFVIYPVVNQVGLKYSPDENEHLLRYDENNFDYNDGWGMPGEKKARETALVEEDILKIKRKYKIIFGISLHEDSAIPQKGYIYTNGIDNKEFRKELVKKIKMKVNASVLANQKHLTEANEPEFEDGTIEEEFCLVEAKDEDSFENWLADKLGIPTVLSEGPFGLSLSVRKRFQLAIIASCVDQLLQLVSKPGAIKPTALQAPLICQKKAIEI